MISSTSKKIVSQTLVFLFCSFFILTPAFVLAQPTGANSTTGSGNNSTAAPSEAAAPSNVLVYICTRGAPGECEFSDLIAAVKKIVNWGTWFALGFSVVVISWAGFKLMISGDNPSERKAARDMLQKVVIGIAVIVCAWLIVKLITDALLDSNITFLG